MPDCPCCPPSDRSLSRRQMLIGGAAIGGATLLSPLPRALHSSPAGGLMVEPLHDEGSQPRAAGTQRSFNETLTESPDRRIMFPVLGLPNNSSTWTDTYNACRGTACSRRHQGQDLMGPRMTKLLACVSGTVVEFRHRAQPSGNSLYIRGDDGWFYCYLHINNDTPNVSPVNNNQNRPEFVWGPRLRQFAGREAAARGVRVERGEHIAYMGDSGNAEGVASHLHFEIRKPAASLWDAAAVNPQYSLNAAEPAREASSVSPETFVPWDNARDFVYRQYQDFLGRAPTAADLSYWAGQLDSGAWTPQRLLAYFLAGAECDSRTHSVTRLYQAFFLRRPDQEGFSYWVGRRREGLSLVRISEFFTGSGEFTTRYGSLSDEAFVDRIYRNVLGRGPDASGMAFWTSKLASGSTRGWVMIQFSESDEYRAQTQRAVHIIGSYGCMLRRMPTADDITTWSPHSNVNMLNMMRVSAEYSQVVGA